MIVSDKDRKYKKAFPEKDESENFELSKSQRENAQLEYDKEKKRYDKLRESYDCKIKESSMYKLSGPLVVNKIGELGDWPEIKLCDDEAIPKKNVNSFKERMSMLGRYSRILQQKEKDKQPNE